MTVSAVVLCVLVVMKILGYTALTWLVIAKWYFLIALFEILAVVIIVALAYALKLVK